MVVRGLSGLSLSQEEEEKEETEEEAVASDSDKSVGGEDTAAGEYKSGYCAFTGQSTLACTYIPNRVRGVFMLNTVCSHTCTWTYLQLCQSGRFSVASSLSHSSTRISVVTCLHITEPSLVLTQ